VTLVPALAEAGAEVTQIQRTPSYLLPLPSEDSIAKALRRFLPEVQANALVRRKNILIQHGLYSLFQRYPKTARRLIRRANRSALPEGYPVDVHFNPPYDPWDQRLCIVPDGDFFRAIRSGRVSIVTGAIDRFTADGVRMASGAEIPADVVVTATGLTFNLFKGFRMSVDGAAVDPRDRTVFRGTMLDGVPNFVFVFGYPNASWTLKVSVLPRFVCRLFKELDERSRAVLRGRTAERRDASASAVRLPARLHSARARRASASGTGPAVGTEHEPLS
jgi:monooxygenase